MTYDPIPHDDLVDPSIRDEAHSLHVMISDVIDRDVHTDQSVLLALAVAFAEQAEIMQVDPGDVLLQIMDQYPALDLVAA